jgi:hypothetical protein
MRCCDHIGVGGLVLHQAQHLKALTLDVGLFFCILSVCSHHLRHQFFQDGGGRPAQLFSAFGGVAQQRFHIRRREEARVDAHHGGAGVGAGPVSLPLHSTPTQHGGGQFN